MDHDTATSFLDGLRRQLGLYREMAALNREQMALLDNPALDNPDELLSIAGRKQGLMDELATLEAHLKPSKDHWFEVRSTLSDGLRTQADTLIAELSEIIGQLLTMENEAHQAIESIMERTQAGLQSIRKQSQVNRAYAAYGTGRPDPKYVDRTTDKQ